MRGKPRLLDLFCGAGGAGMGYHHAGFEVVGVDHRPQPNYPFRFMQRDALCLLADLIDNRYAVGPCYDAIHASPPCQFRTAYRRRPGHVRPSLNLIPDVRRLLEGTRCPYVIENVSEAAAWLRDPVRLCGSSFGLDVRRHRLFETSFPVMVPPCDHSWQTARFPAATNREKGSRCTVEVGVYRIPLETQLRAMGVDWPMTLHELSQAVPPAFTEHLGDFLMAAVRRRSGVAA